METELKLSMDADGAEDLLRSPALAGSAPPTTRRLVSTYHDTAEGALRDAGYTLRVRTDGDRFRQTVKAEGVQAAGLFARPEWEIDLSDATPRIDADSGPIAPIVDDSPLQPRFVTDVTRTTILIDQDDSRIEVSIDCGEVSAGERRQPIAEVELELLDGSVAALFALARRLDDAAPLRLAVGSKSERGQSLRDAQADGARKAEPVRLDDDMDVAEAFAAVAGACLRHFRLNEARLLDGDERAPALHQARVGLRRLRSALSLFGPLLRHDPEHVRFSGALRDLAAALGEVRDLDVLMARADLASVRQPLGHARAAAFAVAIEKLREADTRRLMIDLAEWLAIGGWRARPAEGSPARRHVVPFASDLLSRRRKRLKRRGKHLTTLDDEQRHRVRIEAKKLRYAAEFFASLWTGKKRKRRLKAFLDAIALVQEELGHLNDAAAGQDVLHRLGLAVDLPAGPADRDAMLTSAEEAFDGLMEVKRFWR